MTQAKQETSTVRELMDERDEARFNAAATRGLLEAAMRKVATITARNVELEAANVEREAELIYLRLYGKDGARWSANESKDVWREKARRALEASHD